MEKKDKIEIIHNFADKYGYNDNHIKSIENLLFYHGKEIKDLLIELNY